MEENKVAKHARRSLEERVAEIDKKIATHKDNIAVLEKRKKAILTPKKERKVTMASVIAEMKNTGLSPEEIATKLGLKVK